MFVLLIRLEHVGGLQVKKVYSYIYVRNPLYLLLFKFFLSILKMIENCYSVLYVCKHVYDAELPSVPHFAGQSRI